MSRSRKQAPGTRSAARRSAAASEAVVTVASKKPVAIQAMYAKASGSTCQGRHDEARQLYAVLEGALAGVGGDARLRAFVRNDLAVMAAIEGRFDEALTGWKAA